VELNKKMLSLCKEDLEKIKYLGQGAGGVVNLMRHKHNGQFYALKIIPAGSQEERHMLDTEVSILTKCSSEYLVKTLGAYIDGVNFP
jgi:serine/threonine protein kinase